MSLTKNSTTHQKARLPATLASLNNGHIFNLRAYCVGVRSSSKSNLVHTKPLHPHNAFWRSLLVMNLSNTSPRHVPTTEGEARAVVGHCHVAVMTLACNFIQPRSSFMLSNCTSSFSVSPSLASSLVRRKLTYVVFILVHWPRSPQLG